MNAKLQELTQDLLEGTQTGTLQWTETPEKGVYRLLLDKGLVRIYQMGLLSASENLVGCTVLNAEGIVLHDVQVPRREGGFLVALYDCVDEHFQENALNDLLAEIRTKLERGRQPVTAAKK